MARTASPSTVHIPESTVNAIIDSTCDAPNRFYRYPIARALLPILGRIAWLTPNHVTYLHIAFGLAAAIKNILLRQRMERRMYFASKRAAVKALRIIRENKSARKDKPGPAPDLGN